MDPSEYYILPSHPSVISHDPLGICDEENPTAWAVITASIQSFRIVDNGLHRLPSLIQDLSYSIKSDGHLNTEYLSRFILDKFPDPQSSLACQTINAILDAALSLPDLFPSNAIPYLSETHPTTRLASSQISSLLAHQMLNTLSPPKGNTWGCTFSCWYCEPQALECAVSGYLASLFEFFTLPSINGIEMTYQYHINSMASWEDCLSVCAFDNLVIEPVSSKTVPFPHSKIPCTLIASNKSPGFGSACTQEELVTAACPPLLPLGALLIAPPVHPNAVIIAHGYVPLSQWEGQGREACHQQTSLIVHHTFLLLDATELDESTSALPDLEGNNLMQDLCKAQTGFSALMQLGVKEIASPLWGAGAFGGDPLVKALILSLAAACAGVTVHLAVDEKRVVGYDTIFINILNDLKHKMTVGEVFCFLQSDEAQMCKDTLELWEIYQALTCKKKI